MEPGPLIVTAILLAACGDARAGGGGVTVRDSAGVEIVENTGSARDEASVWAVGEPVLRIGRVEGEAAYLFDGIAGAVRLGNGHIAVANSGSGTVRWYDAAGTFLFERGGKGGGPGEFERLSSLGSSRGDTLHALDGSARRIVRYTADGELVATLPLQGMSLPPGPVQALTDGSYIVGVGGFSSATLGDNIVDGVHRYPQPLFRFSADGSRADTLGTFPGIEIEVITNDRGFGFGPAQFGKALEYAAAGDVVYIGTADRFEIGAYSPDGRLIRSIRVLNEDLRLTPERIEAYKDRMRAQAADYDLPTPELERQLAQLQFPESVPAYTAFLIDDEGNLWVERHGFEREEPRSWFVFESGGRLIGSIELPPRFTPLEVTRGAVMGRQRDELDVETLVIYPIEREQQ